ncbi:YceD family protein [Clostridium tunisiense]|uniref:YceD family protein n=1 Tax=Clostridium tunisiense TaxID=219748 RepID=UPI0003089C8E|nr:DUF177 domain-containing protein [Clostridium tunisiense]
MNIDVSELKGKKNSKRNINVVIEKESFYDGTETVMVSSPIKFDGVIRFVGDIFQLKGKVTAELLLTCSRCLKKFPYTIEMDIEEKLSTSASNEESEIISIKNDKIDMDEIVESNLIIQLPVKRLCSESCKGLCQQCGTDLNHKECSCDDVDVDPRLAKLKDLFSKA